MTDKLKIPLLRYRFLKNPARGVFLDVAVGGFGEDRLLALKILKGIVESLEKEPFKSPDVPESVTEDGICYSTELVPPSPFADGVFTIIMQDGRVNVTEKKPDGTRETFEEAVEREWSAAEIRRAAQGQG